MKHIKIILFSFVLWIILVTTSQAQTKVDTLNDYGIATHNLMRTNRTLEAPVQLTKTGQLSYSDGITITTGVLNIPVYDTLSPTLTVLPLTTTVYNLSLLKNGQYRIVNGTDTLDLTKDTALVITKTVTLHDTVKIATVCPPPVICPVTPPNKQRTAVGMQWSPALQRFIISYDDLTQSNL